MQSSPTVLDSTQEQLHQDLQQPATTSCEAEMQQLLPHRTMFEAGII